MAAFCINYPSRLTTHASYFATANTINPRNSHCFAFSQPCFISNVGHKPVDHCRLCRWILALPLGFSRDLSLRQHLRCFGILLGLQGVEWVHLLKLNSGERGSLFFFLLSFSRRLIWFISILCTHLKRMHSYYIQRISLWCFSYASSLYSPWPKLLFSMRKCCILVTCSSGKNCWSYPRIIYCGSRWNKWQIWHSNAMSAVFSNAK